MVAFESTLWPEAECDVTVADGPPVIGLQGDGVNSPFGKQATYNSSIGARISFR